MKRLLRGLVPLLALTAILHLAGCSGGPQVEDEAGRDAGPATFVVESAEKAGPVVTLLSKGEGPRRALRYHFEPGQRDTLVMDMVLSMKTTMGGMNLAQMDMPVTRMKAAIDLQEVARDGSCRYEGRYFDIQTIPDENTDPAFLGAYEKQLQGMVGLVVSGVITERGQQPHTTTTAPEGMSAELQQSLEQMEQSMQNLAAPFPEEKVGVGATWSVFTPIEANTLAGTQTATYELLEFTEDGARLSVGLIQDFPAQEFTSPDLPEGATMTLDHCDSKAQGFMSVDFGRVVPKSGIVMEMLMDTTFKGMGLDQKMQMEMYMDISAYGLEHLP